MEPVSGLQTDAFTDLLVAIERPGKGTLKDLCKDLSALEFVIFHSKLFAYSNTIHLGGIEPCPEASKR